MAMQIWCQRRKEATGAVLEGAQHTNCVGRGASTPALHNMLPLCSVPPPPLRSLRNHSTSARGNAVAHKGDYSGGGGGIACLGRQRRILEHIPPLSIPRSLPHEQNTSVHPSLPWEFSRGV